MVDEVVRSEEEEVVVTEVCGGVSVTVTISCVGDTVVVTIVWIPKSLSDRSFSTPDTVYEHHGDAGCGEDRRKQRKE